MRGLGTVGLAGLLLLAGSGANAQLQESRYAVRGGFFVGNGFFDGRSQHLEGLTLGGDISILRGPKLIGQLTFSPTVVFGGSTRKGPDTDGNIYRLMLTYRRNIPLSNFYGGVGLGFAFTDANNHDFADVAGFNAQLIAGYQFKISPIGGPTPFVEFSYNAATREHLSGLQFEVGVRF